MEINAKRVVRKMGVTVILALLLPIIVCLGISSANRKCYMIGGFLFVIDSVVLVLLSKQIDKSLTGVTNGNNYA